MDVVVFRINEVRVKFLSQFSKICKRDDEFSL